jgi:hypothetical protein
MRVTKAVITIGASLALFGCAAALPTSPAVMSIPAAGKSLAAFNQDDMSCRSYAAVQVKDSVNAPSQRSFLTYSADRAQRSYDNAYAQCMASRGNAIQPLPRRSANTVSYYYGWGGPTDFDPVYGEFDYGYSAGHDSGLGGGHGGFR